MRERPQAFRRDGSRRCSDVRQHHGDCLERLDYRPALVARLDHDLGDDLGQRCAQPAFTLFPHHTTPRRTPHGISLPPIAEHHTASSSAAGVMQRHRLFASIRTRARHPPQARRSTRPRGSRRWDRRRHPATGAAGTARETGCWIADDGGYRGRSAGGMMPARRLMPDWHWIRDRQAPNTLAVR